MEYAQLNPAETNIHRTPEEIRSGARATLDETMAAGTERSREMARYTDRRVQENPWASVGIAFGAGVVFGAMVTLLAARP
jgi:ElaB/YqjD/DUF883 family membrane-anchored ribosome-binding protein